IREAPFTRFDEVMRALGDVLPRHLDRPFALYGHSMGALLAFETARSLRDRGSPQPLPPFVSGRLPPAMAGTDRPRSDREEGEFIDQLRALNGTATEVLEQPDLMTLPPPTIRADFAVCRSCSYAPGSPLEFPLTVFGGADDKESAEGRLEQ